MQPAIEQVHEVEQKLAHDLEHPEVHDLSFVVRELSKAVVKFWASVDLETRVVCLSGLQLKSRHSKCPLDTEQLLVRRALDIEMPAPHNIRRFDTACRCGSPDQRSFRSRSCLFPLKIFEIGTSFES